MKRVKTPLQCTGIVPPQKNGPSACSKINWTIQNEKGVFEYVQSLILACVEVLGPSHTYGVVLSAVNLPNHIGQA